MAKFLQEYNPMKKPLQSPNQSNRDEQDSSTTISPSPSYNEDMKLPSSSISLQKSSSTPSLKLSTPQRLQQQQQQQQRLQPPSSSQRPRTSARPGTESNPMMAELRSKWTIALRECQKCDEERVGT